MLQQWNFPLTLNKISVHIALPWVMIAANINLVNEFSCRIIICFSNVGGPLYIIAWVDSRHPLEQITFLRLIIIIHIFQLSPVPNRQHVMYHTQKKK